MLLDDGKSVYFGQHLKDVEREFAQIAIDDPLPIARKGIDKWIKTDLVRLEFDNDLLQCLEFTKDYTFKNPLKLYEKTWKNFLEIEGGAINQGMSRDEFFKYLHAWETRAQGFGVRKMDAGDLKEDEYHVSVTTDQFLDAVHISMGPSRRAGGGGIWADGWSAFFSMKEPERPIESLSAALRSV